MTNGKKRRILLTSFGGANSHHYYEDFATRADVELFAADANPRAPLRSVATAFLDTLPGTDPSYCDHLLNMVRERGIEMIIPGADEEAFALMARRADFERHGIVVAVQDERFLPYFRSKTAMYAHLATRGFPVPPNAAVRNTAELRAFGEAVGYPGRPLIIKPNQGRGGRGVYIVGERHFNDRDHMPVVDLSEAGEILLASGEHIAMEYMGGVAYDIDVLRYHDGDVFLGVRSRYVNNSKIFLGNRFERHDGISDYARRLYESLPTKYMIDYDIMLTDAGEIHLLEVNPRPSGSTVSYLPFGINLYYALAKSYLDGEKIEVPRTLAGRESRAFYKMVALK